MEERSASRLPVQPPSNTSASRGDVGLQRSSSTHSDSDSRRHSQYTVWVAEGAKKYGTTLLNTPPMYDVPGSKSKCRLSIIEFFDGERKPCQRIRNYGHLVKRLGPTPSDDPTSVMHLSPLFISEASTDFTRRSATNTTRR